MPRTQPVAIIAAYLQIARHPCAGGRPAVEEAPPDQSILEPGGAAHLALSIHAFPAVRPSGRWMQRRDPVLEPPDGALVFPA